MLEDLANLFLRNAAEVAAVFADLVVKLRVAFEEFYEIQIMGDYYQLHILIGTDFNQLAKLQRQLLDVFAIQVGCGLVKSQQP